MVGFYAVSEYTKVSMGLVLLGICVQVVSFGSPYWTTRHDGHAGLWAGCSHGMCYDRAQLWVTSWLIACQIFMCMSIVTMCAAGVCVFGYVYTREYYEDKRAIFLAAVAAFGAGLFTFLTVVIWAGREYLGARETLNWGFALAVLSCAVSIASGLVLILELKDPPPPIGETVKEPDQLPPNYSVDVLQQPMHPEF